MAKPKSDEPTINDFPGFPLPEQNWSKLPHCLIAALPLIKSASELKVILYILRHTWGFQEFGRLKKLTVDEFMHGRKKRDGTRMDAGTGLSKPSVIDGLRRAEAHGFIEVDVDDHDMGRVKKFYRLRMQGSSFFTPGVNDLDSNGQVSLPRTEKDTLERNLREIWTSSLEELRYQMDRATFTRWLAGSEMIALNSDHATVQVRDHYAVDWLGDRWQKSIERTLTGVLSRPVEVEFITVEAE